MNERLRHIEPVLSPQIPRALRFSTPTTFVWGILLTIALPLWWMFSKLWFMSDFRWFTSWFVALAALSAWVGWHIFVPDDQVAPAHKGRLCIDVAVVLLVTALLYVPAQYFFALDEAQWLLMAKNLLQGYGFVDVSGNGSLYRVGYVAYYMLAYLIGGLTGAAIAPALGLTLFVAMLFLTAQRLYGSASAAIAVLFFTLTPREVNLTAQLIDGLAGAFVFGFFLLCIAGKRNNELLWGGCCAIVLVIAFLVKETAVLCLPLPFLLRFFTRYGSNERVIGFSITAAVLFAVIVPLQLIYTHSGEVYFRSDDLSLQQLSLFPSDGSLIYKAAIGLQNLLGGFASYFYNPDHASSVFRFMPELVLLPVVLALFMKGGLRQPDRAALLTVGLFIPLMAATGWLDWRPEQVLVAIGFFHMFVARLVLDFANQFLLSRLAAFASTILLAMLILFQDTRTDKLFWSLRNVQLGRLVQGESVKVLAQPKGSPEFWSYSASNIQPDSRLWSSATIAGLSGALGSGVHFWIAPLPVHVLGMPGMVSGYIKPGPAEIRGKIWGLYALSEPSADSPFFVLYEDDIRQARQNVSCTVLAWEIWPWLRPLPAMLNGTLMRSAALFKTPLDQLGTLGTTEVLTWSPQDYEENIDRRFVHETAVKQLELLRRQAPAEFEWYRQKFRDGGLDLSDLVLSRLLQGQGGQGSVDIRVIPKESRGSEP